MELYSKINVVFSSICNNSITVDMLYFIVYDTEILTALSLTRFIVSIKSVLV